MAAVLDWIAQHWANASAIAAAAAVLGVVTPFVFRWMDRRHPPDQVRTQGPSPGERGVMIRRVRHKWIAGVLEPSLATAARLALGLEHRPDTLDLGSRARFGPRWTPLPLPEGASIREVFDSGGGALLILGAPGAGKTTLLLQLACDLLDSAEHDPAQPVPVVVNLASWAHRRQPLTDWLGDELNLGYDVPRRAARRWLATADLVLLLDGLDEVAEQHRAECVEAINSYRRDHGLVKLAVCSRTSEAQALAARLRLDQAVELRPPTDAQIETYLGYLEAAGTPVADVRAALASDPGLRSLLRSPLMLHVIALAYHGQPAPALQAPGSMRARQAQLWEAYLARMFDQHPLPPGCGHTRQQAVSWLGWLAGRLRERDQNEFHLDRLEPGWLSTRARQRLTRLASTLLAGLVVGLASGLTTLLVPDISGTFAFYWGLVFGSVAALVAGRARSITPTEQLGWPVRPLAFGLAFGLTGALAGALVGGLTAGRDQTLPVSYFEEAGPALITGLIFGVLGRLVAGRAWRRPPAERPRWSRLRQVCGLAVGLTGAFSIGALAGATDGLRGGLLAGMPTGLVFALVFALTSNTRTERARPNEGIRRSAQRAALIGLVVGLLTGIGFVAAFDPLIHSSNGLDLSGLALAVPFAVLFALSFGGDACLLHFTTRAGLVGAGDAPWRYQSFLDAMTGRLLLHRSGSAYLFIHRLLRDHLADFARTDAQARHRPATGKRVRLLLSWPPGQRG